MAAVGRPAEPLTFPSPPPAPLPCECGCCELGFDACAACDGDGYVPVELVAGLATDRYRPCPDCAGTGGCFRCESQCNDGRGCPWHQQRAAADGAAS